LEEDPVPSETSVRAASGIGAFEGSRTRPEIVALKLWAHSEIVIEELNTNRYLDKVK
jgi:hypothetical protein